MISIVDYEGGNLFSVVKAFEFLGAEPRIITQPKDYDGGKIVIPGVGEFGDAMRALNERHFQDFIHKVAADGVKILGVCAGAQILFERSEESAAVAGLSFFENKVRRFSPGGKIPHMGWNTLEICRRNALLKSIKSGEYVYFAHSFYVPADDLDFEIAHCEHTNRFTAIVNDRNIFGVQFHPEKSQKTGMQILRNFIDL